MTKDELYDTFIKGVYSTNFVKMMLTKFFEANVCIPKGKNRQQFADEIHAYAEGVIIQRATYGGWEDLAPYSMPLRIKPYEPMYEWQWLDIDDKNKAYMIQQGQFLNDNEVKKLVTHGNERKIEETKRERK